MFCKECGIENKEEAQFCVSCGTNLKNNVNEDIGAVAAKKNNTVVEYNIKPEYNWGYKIITIGLSSIFIAIMLLFYILDEYTIFVIKFYMPYVIAGVAVYIALRMLFEKLQYKKLDYNFYSDRVEYKDGFLNISEKELKYKFIRETTMTQNILERIFKIGKIRIHTNASTRMKGFGNARNNQMENGIVIHCITDVKEKYDKIKQIIDKETE